VQHARPVADAHPGLDGGTVGRANSEPRVHREETVGGTRVRRGGSRRIATALAIASCVLTGCHGASESQKVAERFMALYYGEASAARAVTLCTGEAEQKLRREIESIRGVAPAVGTDRPTVTWTLISHAEPDPTTRTYVYEVVAHTADVGALTSTLVMVQRDHRWLVSSLSEEHSPP
jgi:hypothetical protein